MRLIVPDIPIGVIVTLEPYLKKDGAWVLTFGGPHPTKVRDEGGKPYPAHYEVNSMIDAADLSPLTKGTKPYQIVGQEAYVFLPSDTVTSMVAAMNRAFGWIPGLFA